MAYVRWKYNNIFMLRVHLELEWGALKGDEIILGHPNEGCSIRHSPPSVQWKF